MACIEHRCFNCEWVCMDNVVRDLCPKCKSIEITNWSDDQENEIEEAGYDSEED